MAYIIKDEQEDNSSEVAIYAIASPFVEKQIYIGRTAPWRLKKVYSEHYNLRVSKTKELFTLAKEKDMLPPLYLLEAGEMTQKDSFKRCVAWMKYFLDHGYTQTKEDALTHYAEDLTMNTEYYYNRIKDESLEQILQPEGGCFPNYKKKKKDCEDPLIAFRLNAEMYESVKQAAAEQGMSVSNYSKQMTLNGEVVKADFTFLGDYLDSFTYVHDLLQKILFSIYTTGKYYPADLANIQNCVDRVLEIEKKVNEKISETIRTLRE